MWASTPASGELSLCSHSGRTDRIALPAAADFEALEIKVARMGVWAPLY